MLPKYFPKAQRVVLVQDNLNTHKPASLYEVFEPAEARRIAEHFDWRYTPRHGSWLNIAECELSVLARRRLDRRIPDRKTLGDEIALWAEKRNDVDASVNWRFSTDQARVKLAHLYPQIG